MGDVTMLALVEKQGLVLWSEDGHLRCSFPNGTTAAALDALFDEVGRIDAKAEAPTPLLFVATTLRMPDAAARRVIYRRHAELARNRVAVLGTHALQGHMVNFLVLATGHKGARYFTDEGAALGWLAGAG
jgi:hypothetical protein